MDLLNGFASKYGVNVRALKNCCRGLLVLFKESLKRTLTPSQLKDDLVHLGALPCSRSPAPRVAAVANSPAAGYDTARVIFIVRH